MNKKPKIDPNLPEYEVGSFKLYEAEEEDEEFACVRFHNIKKPTRQPDLICKDISTHYNRARYKYWFQEMIGYETEDKTLKKLANCPLSGWLMSMTVCLDYPEDQSWHYEQKLVNKAYQDYLFEKQVLNDESEIQLKEDSKATTTKEKVSKTIK